MTQSTQTRRDASTGIPSYDNANLIAYTTVAKRGWKKMRFGVPVANVWQVANVQADGFCSLSLLF